MKISLERIKVTYLPKFWKPCKQSELFVGNTELEEILELRSLPEEGSGLQYLVWN